VEQARVTPNGNLLVGTTTARNRLTVQGTVVSTPTLGTASGQAFFGEAPGYGMMLGTSGFGYGWIQQQRVDGTATAYDLILQPAGGSVGIGTTTVNVGTYGRALSVASNNIAYAGVEISGTTGGAIDFQTNQSTRQVQLLGNSSGFLILTNGGSGLTERARITSGGDLLVGANSSAGSLSNGALAIVGIASSHNGTTTALNATATTLFTAPTNNGVAYLLTVTLFGPDTPSNYTCVGILRTSSTGANPDYVAITTAALAAITTTGTSVQYSQSSGVTQDVKWSMLRLV